MVQRGVATELALTSVSACIRKDVMTHTELIQQPRQADGLTAFSSDRPLLLLTDFSPGAKGGGAVNIRSLLTPEDRKRILWATLSPLATDQQREVSLAGAGPRSVLRDSTVRVHKLRREVERVMRSHNSPAAWIVAHSACVRIAPGLVAAGVPVHVTVQDDPAWAFALRTRRYAALAPLLARDLRRTLRGARSVEVVSQGMAQRYRARYGVEPTIVNRGLAGPLQPTSQYDRGQGLCVTVLGSTYGVRELTVLAQAMGMVQKRLGISARLTVIGGVDKGQIRDLCPSNVELEVPGYLDEEEGLDILRESYLLYVNYPFDRRGKMLRETSFATKLTTYVMAARPLLLHMPPESSVAVLSSTAPYANLWSSLKPEDGADIIERLWRNEAIGNSFHAEADAVREEHFDLERNRALLFGALNALV